MPKKPLPKQSWWNTFWDDNWTPFWGWLKVSVGGLGYGVQYAGQVITDPSVKSAIDNLSPPPWVSLLIAVFGVVTLVSMAHGKDK